MRSMWNGTLHLAELAIPVGLAPGKGRREIQLTTLHRLCRNPLEQTKQCPIHGEVTDDDLVKAWEVTPGEYLLVEEEELKAAEQTPDEHRLDVEAIVPAVAIEATMVLNTYFLKPVGKSAVALKAYALLASALAELDAAAIVRFNAWRGEHVAAIRPLAGSAEVLVAQTLVVAEDVRTAEVITTALHPIAVDEDELELARELLDRMVVPFDPAKLLTNGRRDRVKQLLEGKLTGEGTVRAEPITDEAKTVARTAEPADLADALRRSLKATKKPRRRRVATTA